MKSSLIGEVVSALTSGGYTVADCTGTQSCFDVLARRGERTFIVKALANIEGLSNSCAQDLLRVSRLLSATPVVVGERMKSSSLSRGVVYERHGVHVLSSETFTDYLKDDAPSVFSIRGNYCVKVNPEELKDSRARRGITQEELAERLGVSKQSVYRYESSGRVSAEVAERLRELLGVRPLPEDGGFVASPSSVSDGRQLSGRMTPLKKEVAAAFKGIGFRISMTNAPFDMLVSEKESVYTAVSDDWRRLERKIEIVDQVSEIMGGYSVCITQRRVRNRPNVLKPEELSEIKSVREFIRRLSEL